ncbi:MAG TPA: cation-transporting P-type ATPase [Thermoleophilaceae bacterium]
MASAELDGDRWLLEPANEPLSLVRADPGDFVLRLRRQRDHELTAEIALRPRLARGFGVFRDRCAARAVEVEIASASDTPSARRLAERTGLRLHIGDTADRVRELQQEGSLVSVLGDGAHAAAAFDASDLAVGLSSGVSGRFAARADLLAPGLEAVGAVVEAGARRDLAVRDGAAVAVLSGAGGATWGALRTIPFKVATRPDHLGGVAAISDSLVRLRGGRPARTVTQRLSDPQPERWGREGAEEVLAHLHSRPRGLTSEEARERWQRPPDEAEERGLVGLMAEQVKSPLVAVLAAGAGMSVALGAMGDVAMIGAVVVANAFVGAWEEGRAGQATRALRETSARTARVLRDGDERVLAAEALVPGDVILLASGDRIAADARLLESDSLEVDEASLTGESLPVPKSADNGGASSRVVLDGTDVTTGTGRAVVVAVGDETRMGAIAAALADSGDRQTPLDARLGRILWRALPLIAVGGGIVTLAGVLRGQPAMQQIALGASVAIAAVPEGLPLLAGVASAGVARRLAKRRALVTRLAAVEALGRVDVACIDKTGTITTGRPAVTLVVAAGGETGSPPDLDPELADVLRTAAKASPSPDAADRNAHPTDTAVLDAARLSGLTEDLPPRDTEARFEPTRGFHATLADRRLSVKGAVEVLAPRCTRVRLEGREQRLTRAERERLTARAERLAGEGLRVLLVAETHADVPADQPTDLTALGFVCISDPLRPTAAAAIVRCREAGVRVVMITGDHPATADAIARAVGLPYGPERLLTGAEIASLDDDALRERLERATVIARSTPLDKLRIVELLRSAGRVVAMTGDGVNDAPALRLADVGVAMGDGGTEVAREAADLVVTDDDFSTLAEALVEGRAFWKNLRRALGLLLGGNAGEVGLMTAAGIAGLPSPLTTRQVLTVNLVTDVLPAVSVAVQPPEHRNLADLRREGGVALDAPLRNDIIRRAVATAAPSVAAYVAASRRMPAAAARSVAYTSIVATQLTQTVDLGWAEGRLTSSVLAAVGGSVAVLAATLTVPWLRSFLGFAPLPASGLALATAAALAAPAVGRAAPVERFFGVPLSGAAA